MMNAAIGSPPDLTRSRSSKSSSFHSSLDPDGIGADDSHFEQIGLQDNDDADDIDTAFASFSLTSSNKTPPSSLPRRMATGKTHHYAASMGSWRDLTGSKRPRYPSLQEQVHGVALGPGHGGSSTPAARRPVEVAKNLSASSLSATSDAQRLSRARSSSPRQGRHTRSPLSLPNTAGSLSHQYFPSPPSRRGSLQPNRKSVQELEDECHDSDEEVPDDAIFWNVPISPRPLEQRTTSFPSARHTPSTSPGRQTSPPSNHYDGKAIALSPPSSLPMRAHASLRRDRTAPSSTVSPQIPSERSASPANPSLRQSQLFNARAVSWTAALSELSEETQSLTEALEAHADREGQPHRDRMHAARRPKSRQDSDKRRPSASSIELPSLQSRNIMIDPLPISKEKEAVLSRTRPSWLPPKSQEEEKRHLKEYQKMMAQSLESDRRKAEREEQSKRTRDDTKTSILRIWDQHVLPNWDHVIRQPRTRELWWRGIAPRSRGLVWQKAVGNELELTENSFKAALARAKNKEIQLKEQNGSFVGQNQRERDWFNAIRRDAKATFPELRIFQPEGPLHDSLLEVLMAYSMYRSDVGYTYGTHLMAALLLLNLPIAQSFRVLSNILNHPLPLAFLTNDRGALSQAYDLTLRALQYRFPDLHKRLTCTLQIPHTAYLEPMFRTLFTKNLPLDLVSRVWDVYVFEGDGFLIRTAVAILGKLEGQLYGSRAEVLQKIGWEATSTWEVGGEDEFMLAVRSAGKEEI